jgi:hypothetical protein
MKRGRPREFNARIPAHIDQAKLPDGLYFDHRWGGGTWYQLYAADVDGARKLRRRNIANAKASLADLHRAIEDLRGGERRGTLDWLAGAFEASEQHKALSPATRGDYAYCRRVLQAHKTKLGTAFSTWPIASITGPILQRLVDAIGKTHPTKANHVARYLRRLFRWGGNRGHCSKVNPADALEHATERKRRQIPDAPIMGTIIAYAAECGARTTRTKGAQPPYLWAVAEIAYLCRLRGIEVVTLTDANALPDGILTNRRKGSRDNIVAWTPRLRAAWDALAERREAIWKERRAVHPLRAEDRPLVVTEDGTALRRAALGTAWNRLMQAAVEEGKITGSQRFGLHAFKRRGITDTPGTAQEKQRASGHKSEAMVHIYDFDVPVVAPAGD